MSQLVLALLCVKPHTTQSTKNEGKQASWRHCNQSADQNNFQHVSEKVEVKVDTQFLSVSPENVRVQFSKSGCISTQ